MQTKPTPTLLATIKYETAFVDETYLIDSRIALMWQCNNVEKKSNRMANWLQARTTYLQTQDDE